MTLDAEEQAELEKQVKKKEAALQMVHEEEYDEAVHLAPVREKLEQKMLEEKTNRKAEEKNRGAARIAEGDRER